MGSIKQALIRRLVESAGEEAGNVIVDGDGHRDYVGGLWEALGTLQFKFMVDQGLEPHHVLLDVACGSLRAGVRFIPYLEPGNYLGIEMHQKLIDAGVEIELGKKLHALKKPELVVSDQFEFDSFSRLPDFAIAQSLFSHLTADDISRCLRNLRAVAKPSTKFYASFFQTERPQKNVDRSEPRGKFLYTRDQMSKFGAECGWSSRYIGDWSHPRDQKMFEYFLES